jgi:hypothetical protein
VLHLHSGNAVEPQLHVVDLPHVVTCGISKLL